MVESDWALAPGRDKGGDDMPAIRDGDHILVIDRKLFHDDNTRFFVGVVEEYDDRVIRLRGFPFHLSPYEVTGVERHGEQRVRVLSMSGDILLYMLPRETDLDKMLSAVVDRLSRTLLACVESARTLSKSKTPAEAG